VPDQSQPLERDPAQVDRFNQHGQSMNRRGVLHHEFDDADVDPDSRGPCAF
jgi:hypothetical protein